MANFKTDSAMAFETLKVRKEGLFCSRKLRPRP
jgi:hypothetical protein